MTIYNIESVDKKIFKQGGKRTSKVSNLQKFIQERKKRIREQYLYKCRNLYKTASGHSSKCSISSESGKRVLA